MSVHDDDSYCISFGDGPPSPDQWTIVHKNLNFRNAIKTAVEEMKKGEKPVIAVWDTSSELIIVNGEGVWPRRWNDDFHREEHDEIEKALKEAFNKLHPQAL